MSVRRRVHRLALEVFQRLPTKARRLIVRSISPSFTVGAMCFVERDDGALLLVRHSYRNAWGVPGGLLKRGEEAADGAVREAFEETGLVIETVGEPAVIVDPEPQRIDIVFRCVPADGSDPDSVQALSPEIMDVRWFPRDALPPVQFETEGALAALDRRSDS